MILYKVILVSNLDYGTSTLIKAIAVKHLKDHIEHKKKEKKEEGQRVKCGLDATRIEYVKIPPKYKTVCGRKRVKTCKVVHEYGKQVKI